ncbi:ParB N-terminal domain-containing protein [Planctomycetota bacterium]
MKLIHLHPDQLKLYERNPRINDHAVDAVAHSIESFGFNCPIIVDQDNRICAGHTRLKAAKKLGLDSVPVIQIDNLTAERFAGFNIADNKTASLAFFDNDALEKLIQELSATDINIDSLGFSDAEFEALLAPVKEFHWDEFDKQLATDNTKTHVFLSVKIPISKQDAFKATILQTAKKKGIQENDFAILAGLVVGSFLGVQM